MTRHPLSVPGKGQHFLPLHSALTWWCIRGSQPGLSGAEGGDQQLMLVRPHPGPPKATDMLIQGHISQREGHSRAQQAVHPAEGH